MNIKTAVFFLLALTHSLAKSNELPDFCHNGTFACHQTNSNSVVAYPIDKTQPQEQISNNIVTNNSVENKKNTIEVDLSNLTWSAFDSNGQIVGSGRVSGGKDFCKDINQECETITGTFTIYRKGGEDCKSTIYPVGRGGAPMPYCMFFHDGYALHGSNFVPDYNASHGCVRMSPEDAQWLNEDFVQEGLTQVYAHY